MIIAVIGAGYWGPNLVRNFSMADGCKVKYVCDLDQKKLDKISRSYPGIIFTSKAEDVFSDPEIQVAAIATPVSTHFGLAKKALEAGKHVFVEKPFTKTSVEAEELIKIAEKKKLILHVDHTFLYYGPVIKIKEIIDSGELGDLYYFDSQRINLGLIQKDVNVCWDLAPHDISILFYLYPEEPVEVSATGTHHVGGNKEELAHISLKYKSGFVAHIHVSWLSPIKLRQLIIGGREKMIYFDDIEPSEKLKVYDKGIKVDRENEDTFNPIYRSGDAHIPSFSNEEALLRECNYFLDCVRMGKSSLSSGSFGLKVVKVLEALDQSLKNEGQFVKIGKNNPKLPIVKEKNFLNKRQSSSLKADK